MPYYKKKYSLKAEDYPNAYKNYSKSISLPIYMDLNNDQTDRIIQAVIDTGIKYLRKGRSLS